MAPFTLGSTPIQKERYRPFTKGTCHSSDHKCESQIGWCEGLKIPGNPETVLNIPGTPKMSRNGKMLWEMSCIPVAVYFAHIVRDHFSAYIAQYLGTMCHAVWRCFALFCCCAAS